MFLVTRNDVDAKNLAATKKMVDQIFGMPDPKGFQDLPRRARRKAMKLGMVLCPGKNGEVVVKFGGTSVGKRNKQERNYWKIAKRVLQWQEMGYRVIVVVSARSQKTNERQRNLLTLHNCQPSKKEVAAMSPTELRQWRHSKAHMAKYLGAGECDSAAMVAMAINELSRAKGLKWESMSLDARDLGIVTRTYRGETLIHRINRPKLTRMLKDGVIPVITGFQGVSEDGLASLLPRGGSDATAVAIAALMGCPCYILSDVPGVMSLDPRVVKKARRLRVMSYEEAVAFANHGGKLLAALAAEIGRLYGVPLFIGPAFSEAPMKGTLVVPSYPKGKEVPDVCCVACERAPSKPQERGNRLRVISLPKLKNKPGVMTQIFEALGEACIRVKHTSEVGGDKTTEASFTVLESDFDETIRVLKTLKSKDQPLYRVRIETVSKRVKLGTVSIVGAGMINVPGIMSRMARCLEKLGVKPQMLVTSDVRVTVVVPDDVVIALAKACHKEFIEGKNEEFELSLDDKVGAPSTTPKRELVPAKVTSVTMSEPQSIITVAGFVPNPANILEIFESLGRVDVALDLAAETAPRRGERSSLSVTVPKTQTKAARRALEEVAENIGAEVSVIRNVRKVTANGGGFTTTSGSAEAVYRAISSSRANILAVGSDDLCFSVMVSDKAAPGVVESLEQLKLTMGFKDDACSN